MYKHAYKSLFEIPGLENWLHNTIGYMICLIAKTFNAIFCFENFFIVGKKRKEISFSTRQIMFVD